VALALGAWTGSMAAGRAADMKPAWSEVAWSFPIDQWGKGKEFRCHARDCGTEITIYLRAKIGFCNCTTGVADDPELERVADFDLLGGHATALADGHPIAVRWMKGRSRPYVFSGSTAVGKQTFTIAFNDHCDAIVATVVADPSSAADVESAALEFLNSDRVIHWAEVVLGL
jgi:hypothetical protein